MYRFVDDLVVVTHNKDAMCNIKFGIRKFLSVRGLKFSEKKINIEK
jgi:hypothetical protein